MTLMLCSIISIIRCINHYEDYDAASNWFCFYIFFLFLFIINFIHLKAISWIASLIQNSSEHLNYNIPEKKIINNLI